MLIRRGVARVGGASPKVSTHAAADIGCRGVWLDSVLRTLEAAHELTRGGAREPALMLYDELARAGGVASGESEREGAALSPEERLHRARARLAAWLRAELGADLVVAVAALKRTCRVLAASVLAIILLASLCLVHAPREIGSGASWVVSSAFSGPSSGVLPEHGVFFSPPMYLFHTNVEGTPQFTVDLGRERAVSAIELRNRLDCCEERARAVHVELSRNGKTFFGVAAHDPQAGGFRDWKASFAAVRARFVRITGTPAEFFHLSDVRIFGS